MHPEIQGNQPDSSRENGIFVKIPAWEFFIKPAFVKPYE